MSDTTVEQTTESKDTVSGVGTVNLVKLVGIVPTANDRNPDPVRDLGENGARCLLRVPHSAGGFYNVPVIDWGDDWGASRDNPKSRDEDEPRLRGIDLGAKVEVVGELAVRRYEDKDGNAQYPVEVVVRRLRIIEDAEYARAVAAQQLSALS